MSLEGILSSPANIQQLNNILNQQNLHSQLPELCCLLFGKTPDVGIIHSSTNTSLRAFLSPNGFLFQALLSPQHSALLYAMNLDNLPAPTRRFLRDMDDVKLPLIYHGHVHYIDSNGILQNISSKKLPKDSLGQIKPVLKIMFNMLEYFIFSFAYSPLLMSNYYKSSDKNNHLSETLSNVFKFSKKSTQSSDFILDSMYFDILRDYLSFILPLKTPKYDKENALGITSGNPYQMHSNIPDFNSINSIYMTKKTEIDKVKSIAKFIIGTFVEFWLCQNDYQERSSEKELMAFWTYVKPCTFTVKAIQALISHLILCDLRECPVENQVIVSNIDHSSQGSEGAYNSVKNYSYRLCRRNLYPFLRLAFENWPADESLEVIVNLWLTYITPWAAFGESFSELWGDFVRDNFLFYSTILLDFLKIASKFDLYSAVRPMTGKNIKSRHRPFKFVEMLRNVLDLFSNEILVSHLVVVETALYSLETYTGKNVGEPVSTPLRKQYRGSNLSAGSKDRSYTNCGPLIRAQIMFFEGKNEYCPIFITSGGVELVPVKKIYTNLIETARRLEYLSNNERGVSTAPSTPSSTRTIRPSEEQHHPSTSFWGYIFNYSHETPKSFVQVLTKQDLVMMRNNMELFRSLGNILSSIWNFDISDNAMPDFQFQQEDPLLSPFIEEETKFTNVAPGVFAPHSKDSHELTWRGKEQVKKGLRKCTNADVPLIPSRRSHLIIKTYEVKILVDFCDKISEFLNQKYLKLKSDNEWMPDLDFGWIRVFAAPKMNDKPMRILVATEYLPPYVSGIANRCKNLVNGYRQAGAKVTVCSVAGTECDMAGISMSNPFYCHQRTMLLPPMSLVLQLLDFSTPVPYDILHVFGPLCLAFVPLLPLFYLRSVKIYVSYHVYLEFYKNIYLGSSPLAFKIAEFLFSIFYFIPFVFWADMVGIPSKTADRMVFRYSKRIHIMKSGLNTDVFKPSLETLVKPWNTSFSQFTQGPCLIYVGRLAGEKNIEFLIKALSHKKLVGYTLVLVGDGPSRNSLESLAVKTVGIQNVICNDKKSLSRSDSAFDFQDEEESMNSKVVFTGMVLSEEIVALHYAHADVFVSASGSETFGFTVAEAMSCGTPSVVVRSGAFASVYRCIDDWMFDEEDMNGYVDRVTNVVAMGNEARDLSRALAVEKYGVSRAINDLMTTYKLIIEGDYPQEKQD